MASCGRKEPPRPITHEKTPSPYGLKAIHRENAIILSWRYPEDKLAAVEFFYVKKTPGPPAPAKTSETLYIDDSAKPGEAYSYTVSAKTHRGSLSDYSAPVAITPSEPPPPPDKPAFIVEGDTVEISWTHAMKDALFNVYKSASSGKYPLEPLNAAPLRKTSLTDSVSPDKAFFYIVRALSAAGDEGGASGELEVGADTLVPLAPTGLQAFVAEDRVVLAWRENPERWVRGYKVFRAAAGGEAAEMGETRTPAFTDFGAVTQKRIYKIRAFGPVKESPFSEPVTVVPLPVIR